MIQVSATQARWFRLKQSGLVTPFTSPEGAASALIGIQAQILPAAALALWRRTTGLTFEEFNTLLYQERRLVKLWGQRHTLHLYPSEEWPLIYAMTAPQKTWWHRKIEREGGDITTYQQQIAQISTFMRQRESIGRSDLRASNLNLDESFLSSWGGFFADLVRRGEACHAEPVGGEGRFAHREVWLPDLEWQPPDSETVNVEIVRRYLHTYGPATPQDVAYWRGVRVGDAQRWIAALQADLVEVILEDQPRYLLETDLNDLCLTPSSPSTWPVHLLYRFDPLLLGLKDKTWLIEEEYYKQVWRPAGHIEGTILIGGRITGTWRYKRTSKGLHITCHPFQPLSSKAEETITDQTTAIANFFNLPLIIAIT